jgi:hypothetical protein
MTLHIQLEFPLTSSEQSALRAMLDNLRGAGVGQIPLPVIGDAPSTAGASLQTSAPAAGQASGQVVSLSAGSALVLPQGGTDDAAEPGNSAYPVKNHVGIDVDIRGLPWDERIHSSNHQCSKTGMWVKRRGLNDDVMTKRIEDELRQAMAAGQPNTVAAQQAQNPAAVFGAGLSPGAAIPGSAAASFGMPVAPTAAAAAFGGNFAMPPAPAPAPAPVAQPGPTTMEELIPRMTAGIQAGLLPKDIEQQVLAGVGLQSMFQLLQRVDLVSPVWAGLKKLAPGL